MIVRTVNERTKRVPLHHAEELERIAAAYHDAARRANDAERALYLDWASQAEQQAAQIRADL